MRRDSTGRRLRPRRFGAIALIALIALPACATAKGVNAQSDAPLPRVEAGRYAVELRVPVGGLYAEEESAVEFRIVDTSQTDPVLGPPGVLRATVDATITMPSMASMPSYSERAHPESVPGDYGVHPTFSHGGDYLLRLAITPPIGASFSVEFPLTVRDADPKRPPVPKPFALEVSSVPSSPRAGERSSLRLVVRQRSDTSIVRDFDVTHTKLIHVIVVRKDLGTFSHEHPTQSSDGSFALDYVFPTSGTYQVFADVAPRARGSQILLASIDVKASKGSAKPQPYVVAAATESRTSIAGGVRATIVSPSAFVAGQSSTWTVRLEDVASGGVVTDLEPYLGAAGHLIAILEDGTTYVHAHPDEAATPRSGEISFVVRLPRPGAYRAWAQFQRRGEVVTVDFVIRAR